jgi:hypothetical protein
MKYLLICSLFLLSLPSLAQTACIQGRVVDTNGAPIASVHITGTNSTKNVSFNTTVQADGSFDADGLPSGTYVMTTKDDAPTSSAAQDTVMAVEKECSTLTLERPVRAKIHLVARNLLTGESIHDVTAAYQHSNQTEWIFSGTENNSALVPPHTDLQLRVGAPGYELSTIDVAAVQPGEQTELPVSLRPKATGCICGKVLDDQRKPIADAKIQIQPEDNLYPTKRSVTNKNGEFHLARLQPGPYSILTEASPAEYSMVATNNNLAFLAIQPGAGCGEITINLGPKAAQLKITVIDAQTQQRLKDFEGSVSGENWTIKLVANPLPVPAFATASVSVSAEGYRTVKTEIPPLKAEEVREIKVELIAQ